MVTGLGLAESTPGPLILVLVFVGYVAAAQAGLDLDPVVAGLLGGGLTLWFTFLPCFVWIFLGAPFVERTREIVWLKNALRGVTSAVVGVIASLAVWFAFRFCSMWSERRALARRACQRLCSPASTFPPWRSLCSRAFC
jgi:chromate transporter